MTLRRPHLCISLLALCAAGGGAAWATKCRMDVWAISLSSVAPTGEDDTGDRALSWGSTGDFEQYNDSATLHFTPADDSGSSTIDYLHLTPITD